MHRLIIFFLRLVVARHVSALKKSGCIEFRQGAGTLVLKAGIPVDRASWFYLPGLKGSETFQPPQEGGKKIYREYIAPGTILEIVRGPEKSTVKVLGGPVERIN